MAGTMGQHKICAFERVYVRKYILRTSVLTGATLLHLMSGKFARQRPMDTNLSAEARTSSRPLQITS